MASYASFQLHSSVSLDQLEQLYRNKLGDKYTYEASAAGTSKMSRLFGSADTLMVIKNGYHRTVITLKKDNNSNDTHLALNEATVNGWLQVLQRQTGLLGMGIIRLIYGNGKEFYGDVRAVITGNFQHTVIDTSISGTMKKMFGKK